MPRPASPLYAAYLFAAVSLACSTRAAVDDAPSCGDAAAAMLEQCADEFEALSECLDAGPADACDMQNVGHGDCIAMAEAVLDSAEHDAAFSRYLCEVDNEPSDDCENRIAACE